MPLVCTEPVPHPREREAWDQTCVATCLLGEVGTAENPRFTYKEAVVQQMGRHDIKLYTDRSIPEDNAALSIATFAVLYPGDPDV